MIRVKKICGVGSIPNCRKNARNWLKRMGVSTWTVKSEGGPCEMLHLSDLPEPERLAVIERELETAGLHMGEYDEAAHAEYLAVPHSIQSEAEKRAALG